MALKLRKFGYPMVVLVHPTPPEQARNNLDFVTGLIKRVKDAGFAHWSRLKDYADFSDARIRVGVDAQFAGTRLL